MTAKLETTEYVFCIDTERDTYEFERAICAYVTGGVDENETDQDYADMFYRDMGLSDDTDDDDGLFAFEKSPFYGHLGERPDGDGLYTPCSVWMNPRRGMASDMPVLSCWEAVLLTEENFKDYPLPADTHSVGIFFEKRPTPELIALMRQRAEKFAREFWPLACKANGLDRQPFVIDGYRLLCETKIHEEVERWDA